jgi:hypothetical protein
MRLALVILALALLPACASKRAKGPEYSAPQSAAVGQAIKATAASIETARVKTSALRPHTAAAGIQTLDELEASVESARAEAAKADKELTAYAAKADAQVKLLNSANEDKNKALESANYWQEKQAKALREIWIWRSIAFVVIVSILGIVLAKLGFKFFF